MRLMGISRSTVVRSVMLESSLVALVGSLFGVGLGNSRAKWSWLPEADNDYIFAIIGEELGFLGCLVVITLYGVLAYAGFRIARRSADRFVQLSSVAITVWLIGQAAMNMGYVVGLLPVTGVQLPLISAGGTSLVLTLFIIGLLARFARSEPEAIEARLKLADHAGKSGDYLGRRKWLEGIVAADREGADVFLAPIADFQAALAAVPSGSSLRVSTRAAISARMTVVFEEYSNFSPGPASSGCSAAQRAMSSRPSRNSLAGR